MQAHPGLLLSLCFTPLRAQRLEVGKGGREGEALSPQKHLGPWEEGKERVWAGSASGK